MATTARGKPAAWSSTKSRSWRAQPVWGPPGDGVLHAAVQSPHHGHVVGQVFQHIQQQVPVVVVDRKTCA